MTFGKYLRTVTALMTGAILSYATVVDVTEDEVTLSIENISYGDVEKINSKDEISKIPTCTTTVKKELFGDSAYFLRDGRFCTVIHRGKKVINGFAYECDEKERRKNLK